MDEYGRGLSGLRHGEEGVLIQDEERGGFKKPRRRCKRGEADVYETSRSRSEPNRRVGQAGNT